MFKIIYAHSGKSRGIDQHQLPARNEVGSKAVLNSDKRFQKVFMNIHLFTPTEFNKTQIESETAGDYS